MTIVYNETIINILIHNIDIRFKTKKKKFIITCNRVGDFVNHNEKAYSYPVF